MSKGRNKKRRPRRTLPPADFREGRQRFARWKRYRGMNTLRTTLTLLAFAGMPLFADQGVSAALAPVHERKEVPELILKDQSGRVVDLREYRGDVVLVSFWATWCRICRQELPWFGEFEAKHSSKGFTVIAVSTDEEGWKAVSPFFESLKMDFKVVLDDGTTSKRYGLDVMPAAFLIDRNGRLAAKYIGLANRENMDSNIKRLQGEQPFCAR
jgi:peroxiredoxin